MNDSISGFASSSWDIRSSAARASAGSSVSSSHVDEPADAGAGDGEPERAERLADRLPLGIENAFLGTDQHGRLHRTTFGSER